MQSPKDKPSSDLTPKDRRLALTILERLLEAAVAAGRLDPHRLNDPTFLPELEELLAELASPQGRITFSRAGTLLERARALARSQDWDFACLLYATWSEHWINGVLQRLTAKAFLKEAYFKAMIRTTTLEAKLTWLPVLLGAPPIHEPHQKATLRLAEARNEFVHFKWTHYPMNSQDPLAAKCESAVRPFEKSVRYLRRWETALLLGDARQHIRAFTRRSPARSSRGVA